MRGGGEIALQQDSLGACFARRARKAACCRLERKSRWISVSQISFIMPA
jgi:hypothetical protein